MPSPQFFSRDTRIFIRLASLVLTLALASCAVQYVSRYDAQTETSILTIQRQLETLFQDLAAKLGTPEAEQAHYIEVYKQLKIDARMLHARAQALDDNRISIEQSRELIGFIDNLEQLHRIGIDSLDLLAIPQQQANQILVAMLKFELAKKRQLDPALPTGRN